jgi:hypothetical protein
MQRNHSTLRAIGIACVLMLGLAACDPESTPGEGAAPTPTPALDATLIRAQEAVAAIEELEGGFTCDEPRPRGGDDFWWLCSGSRGTLDAEIRVYARQVEDPLHAVTMYTSVPQEEDQEQAADATSELILAVVGVTVPEEWRGSVSEWVEGVMPDGGRTLDVPDSGVTAGIQPLTTNEWYVEFYELDGTPG